MYVEGGETMKMQKMISSIMTMGALVFGMLMPIAPVMAQNNTIGANDLGISYGQYTGLGSTDVRITIARIIRVFCYLKHFGVEWSKRITHIVT
jgi:hypothetical protein